MFHSIDSSVLCTGFLKKSPPEEKLNRQWRERWFVLRDSVCSGEGSQEPFSTILLEYYENSKKEWKGKKPISA